MRWVFSIESRGSGVRQGKGIRITAGDRDFHDSSGCVTFWFFPHAQKKGMARRDMGGKHIISILAYVHLEAQRRSSAKNTTLHYFMSDYSGNDTQCNQRSRTEQVLEHLTARFSVALGSCSSKNLGNGISSFFGTLWGR
jgi:hypothetical protein